MKAISTQGLAAGVLATLLLAACGGGDDNNVAGTDVPVAATTSSPRAVSFVRDVVARNSETAEPFVIGGAVLATSDSTEPEPI